MAEFVDLYTVLRYEATIVVNVSVLGNDAKNVAL